MNTIAELRTSHRRLGYMMQRSDLIKSSTHSLTHSLYLTHIHSLTLSQGRAWPRAIQLSIARSLGISLDDQLLTHEG